MATTLCTDAVLTDAAAARYVSAERSLYDAARIVLDADTDFETAEEKIILTFSADIAPP
jgi:hypothetical protein